MKINLKFEDVFGLQRELDNLFVTPERGMELNEFRKLVLDSFRDAAIHFNQLESDEFLQSEIEIMLIMRSPVSDKRSIAYFDLYPLTQNDKMFSFKLYADVLLPLIRDNELSRLKRIWVHEIMHMIDYMDLLKNLKISEEKLQTGEGIGGSFFFSQIRKDRHIVLFNLLMHFRAEGIATLMEYILSGEKPSITDGMNAIKQFNMIFEKAILLISNIETDIGQLNQFLKTVYLQAYEVGAGLILYGLAGKFPDDEKVKLVNDCIIDDRSCLDVSDSDIITKICEFSSFDFIRHCFEKDYLADEIRYLTSAYSDNLTIYESFFSLLGNVAVTGDHFAFMALLKQMIREPMDLPSIEQDYAELVNETHTPDEVKLLAKELLSELRQNSSCEISRWALSYLFNTHDVLDDSIDYFGYLDDMEVMKTALSLIHLCKQ